MIDLSKLNIYQQWGLAHACRIANEPIVTANAALAEGVEPQPLTTVQEYAERIFSGICNSYWSQCQEYGLREQVVPKLMQLTLEEQFALRAQYEIPNVIPDEYLAQLPKQ